MNDITETMRPELEYFLSPLQRIGIVDVGIIQSFMPSTGRAMVKLFRAVNNEQVVLTDVEVIYPGTLMNGLTGDIVNAPCLVLFPRTVVPSLNDQESRPLKRAYDSAGAKCLPLSTRPERSKVQVGFDSMGQFVIACEEYSIIASEHGIVYSNKDNTVQYDLGGSSDSTNVSGGGHIYTTSGEDGQYEIYYLDDNNLVAYRMKYMPDGTYTIQRGAVKAWEGEELDDHDSFHDYMWETVWQMDGTVTKVLNSEGDPEKPLIQEVVNPDGTVTKTLNSEGDPEKPLIKETINPDGSIQLTQTNADGDVLNDITITADGDLTISQTKAENTITIGQDGTLTINTKDAVNITAGGDVTVSSDGDANISAGGDVKVESSGAMELTTGSTLKAGSSSLTLKTMLIDDLLNNLLTNFDTTGSPAAHKTGPTSAMTITQLAQKWGQLLQ